MYNYIIMTTKKCMSQKKQNRAYNTEKAKTILMSWLYL